MADETATAAVQALSLQAGAASRDISPSKPTTLYGYPHVERVSTGVHDPLLATVIVLKNVYSTLVLASLDLLLIEPDFARQLRKSVATVVGCEESEVFIGCTHTHSGPVTSRLFGWQDDKSLPAPEPAYLELVSAQLVAAATAAAESVNPAELAWASADATGVGGNRLSQDGITDPECGILAIRSSHDHKMLAMAMNYGMHPTVMHEDSTLVSADFPFFTRLHIQEHLEAPIPIVYQTGPSGNQSPRRFVDSQTFEEAERLGRKLGAAVCSSLDEMAEEAWQGTAHLDGRISEVELPRNRILPLPVAERLLANCQEHYKKLQHDQAPRAEIRTAECTIFGAEGTVALARSEARGELDAKLRNYRLVEVQLLQIGEVCLIGLPGECFTEYGLEMKQRARRRTFVVSLVNGDLQGYIVTPEAADAGGYEATNAVFSPESGRILVDTALDLINRLHTAPQAN